MAKDKKQESPKNEPSVVNIPPEVSIAPSSPRWVKVTKEQLNKLQAEGQLIGYNPVTSEALIK